MSNTKTKTPTVEQLARKFAGILAEWLNPAEQAQVIEANASEKDGRICHSHDVCDPNQAMIDALSFFGVAMDVEDDEQNALWQKAWALAKAHAFWFGSAELLAALRLIASLRIGHDWTHERAFDALRDIAREAVAKWEGRTDE